MKNYNDEYYLVVLPPDGDQIFVEALQKTANRDYYTEKQNPGEPFFFQNSYREEDKEQGIQHKLPDILMNGAWLIVNDTVRDFLKFYDTKGMQIYPAVYIDDDLSWHENYWFLIFYDDLDCWDRGEIRSSEKTKKTSGR